MALATLSTPVQALVISEAAGPVTRGASRRNSGTTATPAAVHARPAVAQRANALQHAPMKRRNSNGDALVQLARLQHQQPLRRASASAVCSSLLSKPPLGRASTAAAGFLSMQLPVGAKLDMPLSAQLPPFPRLDDSDEEDAPMQSGLLRADSLTRAPLSRAHSEAMQSFAASMRMRMVQTSARESTHKPLSTTATTHADNTNCSDSVSSSESAGSSRLSPIIPSTPFPPCSFPLSIYSSGSEQYPSAPPSSAAASAALAVLSTPVHNYLSLSPPPTPLVSPLYAPLPQPAAQREEDL